ncbi:hypothetical protein ES703_117135 [subsurface metagenome]
MAVEHGSGGVGDRVSQVVAFHQHRIKTGNTGVGIGASPFQQSGQKGKHGWCISLGSGRFAHGQANFPLSHGHPRKGIHQQHNLLPAIPEEFSNSRCRHGSLHPDLGRLVGGRHYNHRALQRLFTQVAFDKLPHLASTLSDQADYVHLGIGVPGDHP